MDKMRSIEESSDHVLGSGPPRHGMGDRCMSLRAQRGNLPPQGLRLLRRSAPRNDIGVRRTGTTLVEAAFVLPLLLLVVLGAIEYGWLFYKQQQITNAARHAARIAILPHTGAETEAGNVITSTDPNVGLLARAHLLDYLEAGYPKFSYTVIPSDPNHRRQVTVQVRISTTTGLRIVNMNAFALPGTRLEPDELGAFATMAMEGL